MTAIELIEEAAKVGKWGEKEFGVMIRCANGWCPIIAVAKARQLDGIIPLSNWDFSIAGYKLGLSDTDIHNIIRAADCSFAGLEDSVIKNGLTEYQVALELRKEMEKKLLGKNERTK